MTPTDDAESVHCFVEAIDLVRYVRYYFVEASEVPIIGNNVALWCCSVSPTFLRCHECGKVTVIRVRGEHFITHSSNQRHIFFAAGDRAYLTKESGYGGFF